MCDVKLLLSSLHANSTVAYVCTPMRKSLLLIVSFDVTQHTRGPRQIVACYQSAKENRGVECDAAEPFFYPPRGNEIGIGIAGLRATFLAPEGSTSLILYIFF